jgi:putative nucleotidyltransferase with HDIG domain
LGVGLVFQFNSSIRFPYSFENNKIWKYQDLYAEFDFPLYKSEAQLSRELDSLKNLKIGIYFNNQDLELNNKINFVFDNLRIPKQPLVQYIDNHVFIENEVSQNHPTFLKNNQELIPIKNSQIKSKKAAIKDMMNLGLIQEESIYLSELLIQKFSLDKQAAVQYKSELIQDFLPTQNQMLKGSKLIQKNEVISDQKYVVLSNYKRAYQSGYWIDYDYRKVLAGKILLITLFLILFYQFFSYFRQEVLEDSSKLLLVLALFFGFYSLASFVYDIKPIYLMIIPFPIVPFVLKAFFDTRLALFTHFILILLIALQLANPFEFVMLQFVAGIFAILTTEGLYKRSQLFISVLRIVGVYCLTFFAMQAIQSGHFDVQFYSIQYQYLIANGFLSLLAFPIIYSFEKVFGLTSDLSLLELSDINHPLLRELSAKAHGTFQHSLQVANLAESAALELGANTLLVRVGAMFHDIGKMSHPLYYVENQSTGINPHDELSYEESAKVIISHVKDGIQLARKHRLPDSIIDFIRTHHGTTKVEYFYKKYCKDNPNLKVSDFSFTYSGPKPFSRETALVMMADAVEAASRSLQKPNRESIDRLVESIIDNQVADRQFEMADITLKEISDTKKNFKKKLINIYHLRIEYPK